MRGNVYVYRFDIDSDRIDVGIVTSKKVDSIGLVEGFWFSEMDEFKTDVSFRMYTKVAPPTLGKW